MGELRRCTKNILRCQLGWKLIYINQYSLKNFKFYLLLVLEIISSDFGLGDLDISLAIIELDGEDDMRELDLSSALGLGNF